MVTYTRTCKYQKVEDGSKKDLEYFFDTMFKAIRNGTISERDVNLMEKVVKNMINKYKD